MRSREIGFRKIVLGGTFSSFHEGHDALLRTAYALGRRIVVGITSDEYVTRLRKKHPVEPFPTRVSYVKRHFATAGKSGEIEIMGIDDFAGPAARDPSIEALVVSPETYSRGALVNSLRLSRGLRPLAIVVIRRVGREVSSTSMWKKRVKRVMDINASGQAPRPEHSR